ncbi:class I SAM-dependent methyltransferase [Gordonia defluvii]|uniref:Class I SAM-dependent methyltransferase n=1 Tax=Gordonia defluvii TaxID=283718 RepID=A0ABP6LM70_9ACTN|nr:class I SAM-dependent methyltransferase [Gordonia sp. UBA5067]
MDTPRPLPSTLSQERLDVALAAPGFLPLDEALALHEAAGSFLAQPDSVGVGVEVGTYCGKSTVFLGAIAEAHGALLATVDHHRGSEEHQPGWEYHDTSLVDPHTGTLDTSARFRRTMFDAELEQTVIGMIASSTMGARMWGRPADFVFIDGGHSMAAAQADFDGWSPWVRLGGGLLIHDVFPDPADGGRPPYEIYRQALAGGRFEEVSAHGSLRVLRRVGE